MHDTDTDTIRRQARKLIDQESRHGFELALPDAVGYITNHNASVLVDLDPLSIRFQAHAYMDGQAAKGSTVEYSAAVAWVTESHLAIRKALLARVDALANKPATRPAPVKASTGDATRNLGDTITKAEQDRRMNDAARKIAALVVQVWQKSRDGNDPKVANELNALAEAYETARTATLQSEPTKAGANSSDDPPRGFLFGRGGKLVAVADALKMTALKMTVINSRQPVTFGK